MNLEPMPCAFDEAETPQELKDLFEALDSLPVEYKSRMEPLARKILAASKRRRKILTLVQDALSQLRLDMKYLVFDLEATRRERDEYQRQLKD